MCRVIPPALLCHLLSTTYPWQKENQKHPNYDIFSVFSVPVCRTRPSKICMCVGQLYPKLCIMHKKWGFHDTQVQFVKNVHRFISGAIGRHVTLLDLVPIKLESERHGESTVSKLFASLCTKDLEARWALPWSNCDKSHTQFTNNSFPEKQVQRTLDLNPRLAAKWSNCAQIHALYTLNKVFLTQKFDLSRRFASQSRVL